MNKLPIIDSFQGISMTPMFRSMGISSKRSNDIPKIILYLLFHLIGIFLAFYFVTKQVLQYQKNDDKSSFFFKQYHATTEDRYPTFSIFFYADLRYPGTLYQNDLINDTLGIDPSDYMNMLNGYTTGSTNFSLLQYDEARWDLRIMLNRYSMTDYTIIFSCHFSASNAQKTPRFIDSM